MLTSRQTIQIEWGDSDPASIIFYPGYFAWFDASTAHRFGAAGLPKPELLRDITLAVEGFGTRALAKKSEDSNGIQPIAIPQEDKDLFNR